MDTINIKRTWQAEKVTFSQECGFIGICIQYECFFTKTSANCKKSLKHIKRERCYHGQEKIKTIVGVDNNTDKNECIYKLGRLEAKDIEEKTERTT